MNKCWCDFCETETEHDGEICLDCHIEGEKDEFPADDEDEEDEVD